MAIHWNVKGRGHRPLDVHAPLKTLLPTNVGHRRVKTNERLQRTNDGLELHPWSGGRRLVSGPGFEKMGVSTLNMIFSVKWYIMPLW